jgi:cell division protein FtsB
MLSLSARPLTVLLGILIIFLQYEIWSPDGGISQVWKLKQSIATVKEQNKELQEKNMILAADVEDLKHGDESIEEHARMDLGMTKKNEVFYQIVDQSYE